jgi:hypothetical protein
MDNGTIYVRRFILTLLETNLSQRYNICKLIRVHNLHTNPRRE